MLDLKILTLEELRNHNLRKKSLVNLHKRIIELEKQYEAEKQILAKLNSSNIEILSNKSQCLNNLMKRDQLKLVYSASKRLVDFMDRGLDSLIEEERTLLLNTACLQGEVVDRLPEYRTLKPNISAQEHKKENALHKLTLSMYGAASF